MKIFLCWSENKSKEFATKFENLLKVVIPSNDLEFWKSDKSISTGNEWFSALAQNLQTADAVMIFLTSENQRNPWIFFEAGAIWNKQKALGQNAPVYVYLLDVAHDVVEGTPFSAFQVAISKRDETLNLIRTINISLGKAGIKDDALGNTFSVYWEKYERELNALKELPTKTPKGDDDKPLPSVPGKGGPQPFASNDDNCADLGTGLDIQEQEVLSIMSKVGMPLDLMTPFKVIACHMQKKLFLTEAVERSLTVLVQGRYLVMEIVGLERTYRVSKKGEQWVNTYWTLAKFGRRNPQYLRPFSRLMTSYPNLAG